LHAPEHDELIVGFVGTLLPHKGVHVLIEALQLLEGGDIELIIHGDSFHASGYERQLRSLAVGDERIHFAGSYRHEEFREILAPLDLVAIPSLWHENLPTTGLNTVAAGVPVIASDVAGLRELVDDYDAGFTHGPGDASALASVLGQIVEDKELLSRTRAGLGYPSSIEEEAWRVEQTYCCEPIPAAQHNAPFRRREPVMSRLSA
jgi:glycosyltransferase involved in cell wall biosynthesis